MLKRFFNQPLTLHSASVTPALLAVLGYLVGTGGINDRPVWLQVVGLVITVSMVVFFTRDVRRLVRDRGTAEA